MVIQTLNNKAEFEAFSQQKGLNLVHFGASWAPTCAQLNVKLEELHREVEFKAAYVDAEEVADVALDAKIEAAPTVLIFKDGKQVQRLNGFHPQELKEALLQQSLRSGMPAGEAPLLQSQINSDLPTKDLNKRLEALINKARLTLFMKGNPDQPRCGFSRQIVQMLRDLNCDFWTFDILSDEEVRQGLKEYSDWPTYPQVYLDGELLGGLDVLREELKDDAFVAKLPKVQTA
ncbi:Glutaredoxin domain-containing protein [Aphelenchoides fujianensis]|nr:Glutaredoxin domain-containing protein [Aphelenchoides fujianensis]